MMGVEDVRRARKLCSTAWGGEVARSEKVWYISRGNEKEETDI
jgi:hypothetical protein